MAATGTTPRFNNIRVDLDKFDESRLTIEIPTFYKGIAGPVFESNITYLDGGKKGHMIIPCPEKSFSGIYPTWAPQIAEGDQTVDNAKDFHGSYPLTSQESMAAPTKEELQLIRVYDAIHSKLAKALEDPKFVEAIPESARNFLLIEREDGKTVPKFLQKPEEMGFPKGSKILKGLKPLYSHPNEKKEGSSKWTSNLAKPKRVEIKIDQLKPNEEKNRLRKIKSVFYDEDGNKISNILDNLKIPGRIEPVISPKNIYFGSHGSELPYGASLRNFIYEANITFSTEAKHERILSQRSSQEKREQDAPTSEAFGEEVSPVKEMQKLKVTKTEVAPEQRSAPEPQAAPVKKTVITKKAATVVKKPAPKKEEADEIVED